MSETKWSMSGEYGVDADSLSVGDWLVCHRMSLDSRDRWCRVVYAQPTAPDLDPCAMDVTVVWDGETKRTSYRIPKQQWQFRWAGQHRPVCGHCGGAWPCDQVEMQRQMNREMVEQDRRCVVCGKSDGGMMDVRQQTPDGLVRLRYHTAKSRKRCRAAFIAAASEDDLRWLRQSDQMYLRRPAGGEQRG